MRVAGIYMMLWLVAAVIAFALLITGSFTSTNTLLLAFFVHGLAGAGLLVVFPTVMFERSLQSRSEERA